MNRYNSFNESKMRFEKFENYYKTLFKFLIKTIFRNMYFNSSIHKNANQNGQIYFNKVWERKKK